MASTAAALAKDTRFTHEQHRKLMQELEKLDMALEGLICHSEVFADLATAEQMHRCGQLLAQWVPEHFLEEESTVFADVSKLGHKEAAFTNTMRRQHKSLKNQLDRLCAVMQGLEDAADLEQCICDLKEAGRRFTRELAAHMGAEEKKLSSL